MCFLSVWDTHTRQHSNTQTHQNNEMQTMKNSKTQREAAEADAVKMFLS